MMPELFPQVWNHSAAVIIAAIVCGALLKLAPNALRTWKEVQLAKIGVRREEAASTGKVATVFERQLEATNELKLFLKVSTRWWKATQEKLAELEATVESLRSRG